MTKARLGGNQLMAILCYVEFEGRVSDLCWEHGMSKERFQLRRDGQRGIGA